MNKPSFPRGKTGTGAERNHILPIHEKIKLQEIFLGPKVLDELRILIRLATPSPYAAPAQITKIEDCSSFDQETKEAA